jgi:hypothetical protein
MDPSKPVVVARAWLEGEASVIKSLLDSYDIPCHYSTDFPVRFYPLSPEHEGPIKIYVPAELAEEAGRILKEQQSGPLESDIDKE